MEVRTKSALKIEFMRGSGPGGQHRNKTESACRITHLASGISAYADKRSREASFRMAMAQLERRIANAKRQAIADRKKARRDVVIHDHTIVRTYNYSRGEVKDHRTGKTATIKQVIDKGQIELLR